MVKKKKGQHQETVLSLKCSFSNISKFIGHNKLERYIFVSKLKKLREKIIYYGCSATRLNLLTIMMASEKYI